LSKSFVLFLGRLGRLLRSRQDPIVDLNAYGSRVPRIVISPYAQHDYVDGETPSFDAYVKFIEDDFLAGQRLDPKTDGRPDPRPTVRETVPSLGDITQAFDFSARPCPGSAEPTLYSWRAHYYLSTAGLRPNRSKSGSGIGPWSIDKRD